jgi:folate-binding protein YgfZ
MEKLILTCRLLFPIELQNVVNKAIRDSGGEELSSFEYNLLRLEAGFPIETRELTEEYSPLEVGLENFISTSKGCYTGQEVIARQLNYDKVARQICGLNLGKMAEIGDKVWSDGQTIGVVTSVGNSPKFGLIALGVLRKPYNQAGTQVLVGSSFERSAGAVCINLPFGID